MLQQLEIKSQEKRKTEKLNCMKHTSHTDPSGEISFILFSSKSITSSYTFAKVQAVFLNAKVRPSAPCLVTKGLALSQWLGREGGGGPRQESALRGYVSSMTGSPKTKPTFYFIVLKNEEAVCVVLIAYLWLTLCNPMNCSPPGSCIHKISQARILEWIAIPVSRGIFPTQEIKPGSPALQADSLPSI